MSESMNFFFYTYVDATYIYLPGGHHCISIPLSHWTSAAMMEAMKQNQIIRAEQTRAEQTRWLIQLCVIVPLQKCINTKHIPIWKTSLPFSLGISAPSGKTDPGGSAFPPRQPSRAWEKSSYVSQWSWNQTMSCQSRPSEALCYSRWALLLHAHSAIRQEEEKK